MKKAVLFVAIAIGLLRFGYKYLDLRLVGSKIPAVVPLIEELSAAIAAGAILLAMIPLIRRIRANPRMPVQWAGHAGMALVFSLIHTTANWVSRVALFGLLGRTYSYGRMPDRYAMEMPMDILVYTLFTGGVYVVDRLREARQQEVQAVELRAKLLESELRNLRAQVEPHFLFNALNAVSEMMYHDPRRADEMIGHLSALLRASLHANTQEVTLRQELEAVSNYVALLQARFRDRVLIRMDADAEAFACAVPSMMLQPLIENSVRHGATADTSLHIHVRARCADGFLTIEVDDNGNGNIEVTTEGIGLGGTRERLRRLYGEQGELIASHKPEGGFRVLLRLPARIDTEAINRSRSS